MKNVLSISALSQIKTLMQTFVMSLSFTKWLSKLPSGLYKLIKAAPELVPQKSKELLDTYLKEGFFPTLGKVTKGIADFLITNPTKSLSDAFAEAYYEGDVTRLGEELAYGSLWLATPGIGKAGRLGTIGKMSIPDAISFVGGTGLKVAKGAATTSAAFAKTGAKMYLGAINTVLTGGSTLKNFAKLMKHPLTFTGKHGYRGLKEVMIADLFAPFKAGKAAYRKTRDVSSAAMEKAGDFFDIFREAPQYKRMGLSDFDMEKMRVGLFKDLTDFGIMGPKDAKQFVNDFANYYHKTTKSPITSSVESVFNEVVSRARVSQSFMKNFQDMIFQTPDILNRSVNVLANELNKRMPGLDISAIKDMLKNM